MNTNTHALYHSLYRIRRFEETVLENFPRGVFYGTTHTYLGQEANAAGVLAHLQAGDIVFSNHRCHGHFLAYGGDPQALFAELMGKPGGVCAGRGGSQHLHWSNFYSNGVQGGIAPQAVGMALAEKIKGSGSIAIVFLGDGTLGEGAVYEALNLAALWQAPMVFVLENNRIAQTTPIELAVAGSLPDRFKAFGIPLTELDSSDVQEIFSAAEQVISAVRSQRTPAALLLHTCRFGPHSKGDDTRPPDEVQRMRSERDPLRIHAPRLPQAERMQIEAEVDELVRTAFENALHAAPYDPQNATPFFPHGVTGVASPAPGRPGAPDLPASGENERRPSVLDSLNAGLWRAMAANKQVVLLGEDVLDPYGGAFKVTRGLSTAYPQQVFTTPISEAGILGVGGGLALRGLRPVVEIMFGDFTTLAADQIINHIAKFRWMYNDQVRVPLVLRTPMGGRRGYGPTHSQSLEKHFLGVPGLHVLAPSTLGDPGALLEDAILHAEDPILFVENKLLYLQPLLDSKALAEFDVEQHAEASYLLRLRQTPPVQLTIAAYGYMAELARQAVLRLAYEHEVFAELYVPQQLAPFRLSVLFASLEHTHRLLAVEEGTLSLGWGAEILARSLEALGARLTAGTRVAALDLPVPASGVLEQAVLPGVEEIITAALKVQQI